MNTLQTYYSQVVDQISTGNYTIKIRNKQNTNLPSQISPTAEALHYLMYQYYCDKRKSKKTDKQIQFIDLKRNKLFDYVIIPDDCDYDFNNVDLYEFLEFIRLIKG